MRRKYIYKSTVYIYIAFVDVSLLQKHNGVSLTHCPPQTGNLIYKHIALQCASSHSSLVSYF